MNKSVTTLSALLLLLGLGGCGVETTDAPGVAPTAVRSADADSDDGASAEDQAAAEAAAAAEEAAAALEEAAREAERKVEAEAEKAAAEAEEAARAAEEAAAAALAGTVAQQNAYRSATNYLDFTAFSRSGLIDQLEFEDYSTADAEFAVARLEEEGGVDWNEQAAKAAANYLDFTAFSRQGLIDQLLFEGYTAEQAEYGVSQTGL